MALRSLPSRMSRPRWAPRNHVMAEARISTAMLFSDLDILLLEVESGLALRKFIELSRKGQEPSLKCMASEIRKHIMVLRDLLNKLQSEFLRNVEMRTSLEEVQNTVEKEQEEAQHFLEIVSAHRAWENCGFGENEIANDEWQVVEVEKRTQTSEKGAFPRKMLTISPTDLKEVPVGFGENGMANDEWQVVEEEKRTQKSEKGAFPRKMLTISPTDLKEVPVYMKGRLTCDQINAVVNSLNRAVTAKYKIRNQSPVTMNSADRIVYYRYIKEENKDTKGCYFVVEEDIRLFTTTKMDKRFYQILTILRHTRRLREIRTYGIIRYVIC